MQGRGLNLKPPDEIFGTGLQQRSRVKLQADQQPQKCPRCDSLNTKFCYYNNYSLSQPRYFCKTCRRYWTKGGTLRNIPVGGGCRKGGKRPKRSSISDNSSIHQVREPNFPAATIGAIRPQILVDHSSTGVISTAGDLKIPAGLSSLSSLTSLPQFSDGHSLGEYGTVFGLRHPPLLPEQAPTFPTSGGNFSGTEQWTSIDNEAVHGSSIAKDGLLHLLPPFAVAPLSMGTLAATSVAPYVKSEQQTVCETSSASGGVGCWNGGGGSSSSNICGQWPDFSGYSSSKSFL